MSDPPAAAAAPGPAQAQRRMAVAVPPRLMLPRHPNTTPAAAPWTPNTTPASSSSSSSAWAQRPLLYTPTPMTPASTPSKQWPRPNANSSVPWLTKALQLASMYAVSAWLRSNPSAALEPLAFAVLAVSALLTWAQLRRSPGRSRHSHPSGAARLSLAFHGAVVALVHLLHLYACRAVGPMESVLAEFAGAVAAAALLDPRAGRGRGLRRRLPGAVALVTALFMLSRGWDRAGCFPSSAAAAAPDCNRAAALLLVPVLGGGALAHAERGLFRRASVRHLGKLRVRAASLSVAAALLFPPAAARVFASPGTWTGSAASWALAAAAAAGASAVAAFSGEIYAEERLRLPRWSERMYAITAACAFVLDVALGLDISLPGSAACAFVLWIGVREVAPSASAWAGNSILGTDAGPAWDAWDSLVRKPLRHVWSERKSRKIAAFLVINTAFMVVEMAAGFASNSLGLISDACHMLFDCAALAIGLYASYMARLPANGRFNFGYGRVEVLSGFVNAVLLVLIGSLIVLESLERILEPQQISTDSLLIVSVAGLLVNVVGLVFFHEEHHHAHGGGGCSHSHSHSHAHLHSHGDAHSQSHCCHESVKHLDLSVDLGIDNHGGHSHFQSQVFGDPEFERKHRGSSADQTLQQGNEASLQSHGYNEHSHSGCSNSNPDHGHYHHQHSHVHSECSDSHSDHIHHHSHVHNHGSNGHSHSECSGSHSEQHHQHGHGHSHSGRIQSCSEHRHDHDHSVETDPKPKKHLHIDHNMEGIFLHVLADTLGSVGVVTSTLLIKYKGWLIADPACSIFISFMIISSVIPLLRNASEILLQRIPRNHEAEIKQALKAIESIRGVHGFQNFHVWSFTNTETIGTLHLQVSPDSDKTSIKSQATRLLHDAGVHDLTLQVEHVGFS